MKRKFTGKSTLSIECGNRDKEICISEKNPPRTDFTYEGSIKELVVYGNKKVEEIFFDKSICPSLEKISIKNTSIRSLKFLEEYNFTNLNELDLENNCIKTTKEEILNIIKLLKKIKKINLSNSVPTFSENCNHITNFQSNLKLPKFVSVENCEPYIKNNPYDTMERIINYYPSYHNSLAKVFQNSNYSTLIETNQKPYQKTLYTILISQFVVITGLFFLFLRNNLKKMKARKIKK